jgi:hypothetical protein
MIGQIKDTNILFVSEKLSHIFLRVHKKSLACAGLGSENGPTQNVLMRLAYKLDMTGSIMRVHRPRRQ